MDKKYLIIVIIGILIIGTFVGVFILINKTTGLIAVPEVETEKNENGHEDSHGCGGITCFGFCYGNDVPFPIIECINDTPVYLGPLHEGGFVQACRSDSDCNDGRKCDLNQNICQENPDNSIVFEYDTPEWVAIVPGEGAKIEFRVNLKNTTDTTKDFVLESIVYSDVAPGWPTEEYIEKNIGRTVSIKPQEEESFRFTIVAHKPADNGTIMLQTNLTTAYAGPSRPILVLEDYGEDFPRLQCGNKMYTSMMGHCAEDILFPSVYSCGNNFDCERVGLNECYNYTCLSADKPSGTHVIEVVPIFLYDATLAEINGVKQAFYEVNDWAAKERKHWGSSSDFMIRVDVKECGWNTWKNTEDLLNKMKNQKYAEPLDFYKSLARFCEEKINEGSIIYIALVFPPENKQSGWVDLIPEEFSFIQPTNFVTHIVHPFVFQKINTKTVIIHEILHSFGERDFYSPQQGGQYHLLDCPLYGGLSGVSSSGDGWGSHVNRFYLNNEHLCSLEARVIGWR